MKHQLLLTRIIAIGWALFTWHLTTTPNLVVAPENLLNTVIMMGGHFTFFGVQAVLIQLSFPPTLTRRFMVISALVASLYGLLIELVQRNIPGRSMDPVDWFLDTMGALIFLAILNTYYQKLARNKR